MSKIKPRIRLPKTAKVGEIVTIKTMLTHPMVSGQQRDEKTGERIPRMIVHSFEAKFNGKEIINVRLDPSVSANPYFKFTMKVPGEGELYCRWEDDEGSVYEGKKSLSLA